MRRGGVRGAGRPRARPTKRRGSGVPTAFVGPRRVLPLPLAPEAPRLALLLLLLGVADAADGLQVPLAVRSGGAAEAGALRRSGGPEREPHTPEAPPSSRRLSSVTCICSTAMCCAGRRGRRLCLPRPAPEHAVVIGQKRRALEGRHLGRQQRAGAVRAAVQTELDDAGARVVRILWVGQLAVRVSAAGPALLVKSPAGPAGQPLPTCTSSLRMEVPSG
jgi:hypothetical protein